RITAVIRESATRMGQLIDDLLAFSRTGKQSLHKTVINTTGLVKELIADPAVNQEKQPTWDIAELPAIFADRNTIRQVWSNLLGNAVKYSGRRKDAKIEIRSSSRDNMLVFSIRDNGVGFDPKYKDKLFKVFHRLHDNSEFEGTGVVLALVDRIVARHQGTVWAEAVPGEGACFYFSLPIKQ
ncbi:MAG: GHKL domain-containing protein, partial [Sphingobacteriales bacterium]